MEVPGRRVADDRARPVRNRRVSRKVDSEVMRLKPRVQQCDDDAMQNPAESSRDATVADDENYWPLAIRTSTLDAESHVR